MKIEKVNINELISPSYNPREISPEEMEKLKTSIQEFGYVDPIIVNEVNNHIVGGNQRYEALKELGYTEVDVVYVHEVDENREKALNIALNKISGRWDELKLNQIFEDMQLNHFDEIKLTGFEDYEIQQIGFKNDIDFDEDLEDIYEEPEDGRKYKEVTEDDFEVQDDEDIEINVNTGDLYQLGNHYLLCGDSTKEEDVKKLMQNTKADTVFTDPPYDFMECNYHKNIETFTENAHIFIMNDDVNMVRYLKKSALKFKQFFVANFGFASSRGDEPYPQHILISHEENGTAKTHQNLHDNFCSIVKMEYQGTLNDEKFDHKHQKSIEFISKFLSHYATKNVLDLFGGSGSTLIACEQLNLNCYMVELEPKYCQIIINRWEKYAEEKAVKIN